jgi:hypothetical protein
MRRDDQSGAGIEIANKELPNHDLEEEHSTLSRDDERRTDVRAFSCA